MYIYNYIYSRYINIYTVDICIYIIFIDILHTSFDMKLSRLFSHESGELLAPVNSLQKTSSRRQMSQERLWKTPVVFNGK